MVIYTHKYCETEHVRIIEKLSVPSRVLFALLCASRLLPAYRRFHERTGRGDSQALENLAEDLWQHLIGNPMSCDKIQVAVDRCMELIPTEDKGWDEQTQPYAEDAVAALAYALRAALSGDAQEAAWAGRRAYEAVDHHAGRLLGGFGKPAYDEQALIEHPAVQAELGRQSRDLTELRALEETDSLHAQIAMLRRRAEREAATVFTTT